MSTSIQPVSAAGHIGPNRTIYCSEAETASSAAEHLTLGAFVEGSIDTDIEKEAANVAEDRLFGNYLSFQLAHCNHQLLCRVKFGNHRHNTGFLLKTSNWPSKTFTKHTTKSDP